MQQAPNVFGRLNKHLGVRGLSLVMHLNMQQGVLQCPGNARQGREPDRGGTAGQRMRQRHRRVRQGFVQFQRPLTQLSEQTARPFIGLVQVNVVQRNVDAQAVNHLDLLFNVQRFQARSLAVQRFIHPGVADRFHRRSVRNGGQLRHHGGRLVRRHPVGGLGL